MHWWSMGGRWLHAFVISAGKMASSIGGQWEGDCPLHWWLVKGRWLFLLVVSGRKSAPYKGSMWEENTDHHLLVVSGLVGSCLFHWQSVGRRLTLTLMFRGRKTVLCMQSVGGRFQRRKTSKRHWNFNHHLYKAVNWSNNYLYSSLVLARQLTTTLQWVPSSKSSNAYTNKGNSRPNDKSLQIVLWKILLYMNSIIKVYTV